MDNMGSTGGEDLSGMPDNVGVVPNTFEQNFGPSEFEIQSERRQEQFREERPGGQTAELGREALEAMPFAEMSPAIGAEAAELGYGDANAQMTEVDGKLVGTDLTREVKRNNERLTKNTIKEVEKIGQQIEKNPHDGVVDFNLARKAYMREAFNREIGARNDGSTDANLNIAGNQKARIVQFPTGQAEQRKAA